MKRRVAIGAGGTARVLLSVVRSLGEAETVIGILDDDRGRHGSAFCGYPVLGATDALFEGELSVDEALIAVGATSDAAVRSRMFAALRKAGIRATSLRAPSCEIDPSVRMGEGCLIMPGVIVNPGTVLGDNVFINTGTIIEHDVQLGDSCFIGPGCTISGCVTVGEETFIGSGTVTIGYLNIGRNVTVGAGSVLIRDVPDDVVTFGNPSHHNVQYKDKAE